MMKLISGVNQEKGSVMIVALLILVLLTVIGISATTTSTTEVQIATNDQLNKMVFYAADAGLEVGRRVLSDLKAANPGNWDNLLSGTTFTWQDTGGNDVTVGTLNDVVYATSNRQVGNVTFTLTIQDNTDWDGRADVDSDNMVNLTSTATYRNAQAQVQALVRYTGPDWG